MGAVEELLVPLSLSCFALGTKQEWIGDEWNDLSRRYVDHGDVVEPKKLWVSSNCSVLRH